MTDKNNKKIKLIIPSDDTHREIFKLKAEKGFRNADEVLKFLLDIYNKWKISQELKRAEANINNSNFGGKAHINNSNISQN